MTPKSAFLSSDLAEYVSANSSPVDDILRELAQTTAAMGGISSMQIAPEQGVFMHLIASLVRPSFAVEVGTFTGYSSICIARALAPGGRLLCCDVSKEWTAVARDHWAWAGLTERIDLEIAPAAETLKALPHEQNIDLAFIDADKTGYRTYWDEIVPRLRPGGIVMVDNVLWSGKVVDPGANDEDTLSLREFNAYVHSDPRVQHVLLPLADGLTVARRVED